MIIESQSPKEIYLKVGREVAVILQALETRSQDQKLAKQQDSARGILQGVQQELNDAMADLQSHAEWDTFTLAFYGETGAGKSTLIETLRILLDETSKVEQRQRFRQLQASLGLSEEALQQLEESIVTLDEQLTAVQSNLEAVARDFDQQDAAMAAELDVLTRTIADKKNNANLFQRLLNALRKLPEEKLLVERQACIEPLTAQRRAAMAVVEQQKVQLQAQKTEQQTRQHAALEGLAELNRDADGSIIGDGRPDFTRQTHRYDFCAEGQRFALLDVPGIEGDEKQVKDEIDSAVKKAHAVFYVTSKPTAPQKGDEARQGTLEKIKAHLGAQTEVWSLFNKRVTNPMLLEKPQLVSEDEQVSLQDLDIKMREQLGEHYQHAISLSAWPAFLAVADCLVPRSSAANNQAKFLSKLPAGQMLDKSGLTSFCEHLSGNLVKDHRAKIKRSNLHKVRREVSKIIHQLSTLRRLEFRPLEEELRLETNSSQAQLGIALQALETRLTAKGEEAIRKFKTAVRKEVYARIENDIGNDDFRSALERSITGQQEVLERELPSIMQAEVDSFAKQIAAVVARFEAHAKHLLSTYSKLRIGGLSVPFKVDIKIDNGINLTSLLGTLAGGALMFWNPAGWAIMALGGITLLVSLGKALYGAFNTKYKQGQQRKSVDENLEKIAEQLQEAFHKSLASALPELKKKVAEVQADLNEPVAQIAAINQILGSSLSQLTQLSNEIQAEGNR